MTWEPPLYLILLACSMLASMAYANLGTFAVGLLGWSLWEYAIHRWILHGPLSTSHRVHHIKPAEHLSLPIAISAPSLCAFMFIAPMYLSGILCGYAAYELVHRLSPPWHKQHHKNPSQCFGVSTPAWDWILGTTR